MQKNPIVSIQFESGTAKYDQIASEIRRKLLSGEILPGERLPSIRALASDLGVNTVTVVKAYESLEKEALVEKRKGSGVFAGAKKHTEEDLRIPLQNEELYGDDEIELMQQGTVYIPDEVCNLSTSTPTADLFPIKPFQDALNRVLDRDGGAAFLYDESNGYLPLREQLSTMLGNEYSIDTEPERLQIISGAQQGIDITAKALISPGDCVLVEDPSYTGALAVFRSRGAQVVGIPLEDDGIDMEYLRSAVTHYQPKALYLMPDFQNPTGISYSDEKRRRLIELAREHRFYIIEDDYISDLHYGEERRLPPIKAYDDAREERVIYVKSFSKLVMPGLRIGFLVSPAGTYSQIMQAKHMTDISSSAFIQRTFTEYLSSGIWEDHLKSIREVYTGRFDRLCSSVDKHLAHWVSYDRPSGGFNLWIRIPETVSAVTLYQSAAAEGILITPGNVFRSGSRDFDDCIRLSIAAVSIDEIDEGVAALARVLLPLMHAKKKDRTGRFSPIL